MSKPKISLITCTYFRPDLLRRAIQSVQQQTFQDYEHLIISDHCPFAESVYNDFKQDDRIKFFKTPQPYLYNLGARSFNLGIQKSQSDYISYLLDDDVLYSNHLEEHYFQLNNNIKEWGQSHQDILSLENTSLATVKNILSYSIDKLKKDSYQNRNKNNNNTRNDVGTLCHRKDTPTRWIRQSELSSGWEDGVFMNQLGVNSKYGDYTAVKICWGGIHKKNTKGTDPEYYDLLMKKLVEDKNSYSGFQLINQPYVYPELKNTLYGI